MKYTNLILFIVFGLLSTSCNQQRTHSINETILPKDIHISVEGFQSILDTAGIKGSILIYSLEEDKYYSNDFSWANKGHLPASTFKIPNSVIAIETRTVENDSTLLKWDGERKAFRSWEQDLILRDAFHFSCVPCYQDIARRIGTDSMIYHLQELDYGKMSINDGNLDRFWLEGDSKISQFQQIGFLERLHLSALPITNRTDSIMKKMIIIKEAENYIIRGKTGWSIKGNINNGWFVGYIVKPDKTYFFATNVEPDRSFDMKLFPKVRKQVSYEALKYLKVL